MKVITAQGMISERYLENRIYRKETTKMNKWLGIGRLTSDPEIRYSQGENPLCIARYRLAIDKKYKKEGEQETDFISCIAFGKQGEFAEKYLRKGMKIGVEGRIQTGSYTNKDGQKVYTTDIVVEAHDFCESKGTGNSAAHTPQNDDDANGFIPIGDIPDEELPFA